MNDVDKVRLLLLSRNDYISSPRISRVYDGAEPGPQASSYVPCSNCEACGRVRNRKPCIVCSQAREAGTPIGRPRHGCDMCPSCDGRGERKRRRGEAQHDAYSNMPLEDAVRAREDDKLKHAPRRRWDGLRGDERLDMTEDPMWRRKQAYEASGSYAELDKQLEWLDLAHQGRFEMLMHWLDAKAQDGLWWSWSQEAEAGVHDTMVMLARRMSKPIRVPNWIRASLRVSKREAA